MKQNPRGFTQAGPSLLATFAAEAGLSKTSGSGLRFSALGQLVGPSPVEAREHRYLGWRRVATAAVAIAGLVGFPALAPAAGPAAVSAAAPVPVFDWQPVLIPVSAALTAPPHKCRWTTATHRVRQSSSP